MKNKIVYALLLIPVCFLMTACSGESTTVDPQTAAVADSYNTFVQENAAESDEIVEIKEGNPSEIKVSDVVNIFKGVDSVGTDGWIIYVEKDADTYSFYSDPVMSTVVTGTTDSIGKVNYMEVTTDLSNSHEWLMTNEESMLMRQGSLHYAVCQAVATMLSNNTVTLPEVKLMLSQLTTGEPVKFYGWEYQESFYNGRNAKLTAKYMGRNLPEQEVVAPFDITMFNQDMLNAMPSPPIFTEDNQPLSTPSFPSANPNTGTQAQQSDQDLQTDQNNNQNGQNTNDTQVSVIRLNNKVTGEHIISADTNEIAILLSGGQWIAEDLLGTYEGEDGPGVFRLYNPKTNEHLFTIDSNEANTLATKYGWEIDNNGKPIFYAAKDGSKKVYRMFNPSLPEIAGHHYCSDVNEINSLLAKGWQYDNDGEPVFTLA